MTNDAMRIVTAGFGGGIQTEKQDRKSTLSNKTYKLTSGKNNLVDFSTVVIFTRRRHLEAAAIFRGILALASFALLPQRK